MRRTWWFAAILTLFLMVPAGCKSDGETRPDEPGDEMAQQEEAEGDEMAEEDQQKEGDTGITEKMADEHEGDKPTPSPMAELEPAQPVDGQEVTYGEVDGTELTGYLAAPKEAEGDLPGIIVIHEWWGLNDNIRKMTRALAGEGYRALAVDLYDDQVAESPDKAKEYMQAAMGNQEAAQANLKAAYQYLEEEKNAGRIGVIGWCFGGGWSLRTALMMPDKIDATVIYYGQLVTDKQDLKKLQMPLIGFFGSEDSAIPPKKVREFESTLEELGKEASIRIYEGANHAFANPSGERYDPEAATDAWKKTTMFLDEHLTPEE